MRCRFDHSLGVAALAKATGQHIFNLQRSQLSLRPVDLTCLEVAGKTTCLELLVMTWNI